MTEVHWWEGNLQTKCIDWSQEQPKALGFSVYIVYLFYIVKQLMELQRNKSEEIGYEGGPQEYTRRRSLIE